MTLVDTVSTTALAPPYPTYMQPGQGADAITARILARLQGTNIDLSEGSWEMDWINLMVAELSLFPDALWRTLKSSFMLYPECTGVLADYRAVEENVDRIPATNATAILTFTAPVGTLIAAGTRVAAGTTNTGSAAVVFATLVDMTVLPGSTTVAGNAVCLTKGPSGNVPAGALNLLLDTIAGVAVTVTNAGPAAGGLAAESTDSLKTRYFTAVRNRGTSGDPAQWRQWAMSVAGVGDVAVVRTPGGPGSVGISLLGLDGTPASTTVVQAVQNYLLGTATVPGISPIGPTDVRVYAAPTVSISVSAVVTYQAGANVTTVRNSFTTGMTTLLKNLAFNPIDNSVHPDAVGAVLTATPGVAYYDISTLRVAGQTTIVTVPQDAIAVLGPIAI